MKTLILLFSLFVSPVFAASVFVPVGPVGNATSIWSIPISSTAPTDTQALIYNSTTNQWIPGTVSGGGSVTLSGDVTGASGGNTVIKIQGVGVSSVAPSAGQILFYNSVSTKWQASSSPASIVGTDASFGPAVPSANQIDIDSASKAVIISTLSGGHAEFDTESLQLYGNASNTVSLQFADNASGKFIALKAPSPVSTSITLLLPNGVGSSGQVLSTDGNNPAQLSWASSSGSSTALANGKIWVGNSGSQAVAVSVSGDATIGNTGVLSLTPVLASTKFWVGNASSLAVAVSSSGDATFNGSGAFSVLKIQGVGISTASPSSGQQLTYNSTTSLWTPQTGGGGGNGGFNLATATAGGNQTCNGPTNVSFSGYTISDPNGYVVGSTFVAQKTGAHLLTLQQYCSGGSVSSRIYVVVNGSALNDYGMGGLNNPTYLTVPINLTIGDAVSFQCLCGSGSGSSILGFIAPP